jgi:phosphatidylglycerophosphatase A
VTLLARVVATWFYLGYLKPPGTMGTLGALIVASPLHVFLGWGPWHFLVLGIVSIPPAIWAASETSRATGLKDPQIVVVDEVSGMWLTLAGVIHETWVGWVAAFFLFRLFDIVKLAPARQLENLPGGVGIVADDVAAGIYGALVMLAAGWANLY